jgi:hypothetical protein
MILGCLKLEIGSKCCQNPELDRKLEKKFQKEFDQRIYTKNVSYIEYFVLSKSHGHRVLKSLRYDLFSEALSC